MHPLSWVYIDLIVASAELLWKEFASFVSSSCTFSSCVCVCVSVCVHAFMCSCTRAFEREKERERERERVIQFGFDGS